MLKYTALRERSREALSQASYSPRKLFGIHIAVTAGLSLILSVLAYVLNMGVADTSGLDAIGTRTLLLTVQELLDVAVGLATPFWSIGLSYAALRLIRNQRAEPSTLLEGFRKLGPVLRMLILQILLLLAVVFGAAYAGAFAGSFLFAAYGLVNMGLETVTEEELMILLEDPVFLTQLLKAIWPMLVFIVVAVLAVLIPVLYRLRMVNFALMDKPEEGARKAIKASWKMTKGNCMGLFRLDLRFWWFYVLEILLTMLLFLPDLFAQSEAVFWLCAVACSVGRVVLYALANPRVQTTYAAAYEVLQEAYNQPAPEASFIPQPIIPEP